MQGAIQEDWLRDNMKPRAGILGLICEPQSIHEQVGAQIDLLLAADTRCYSAISSARASTACFAAADMQAGLNSHAGEQQHASTQANTAKIEDIIWTALFTFIQLSLLKGPPKVSVGFSSSSRGDFSSNTCSGVICGIRRVCAQFAWSTLLALALTEQCKNKSVR